MKIDLEEKLYYLCQRRNDLMNDRTNPVLLEMINTLIESPICNILNPEHMSKYNTNSKVGNSYPSTSKNKNMVVVLDTKPVQKRSPKVAQQQLGIIYPDEIPRAKKLSKKAQILLHTFQHHA